MDHLPVSNPGLPPSSGTGHGRNIVLLTLGFVACLAWIVLVRLHTANEPLERDICTQILMGRLLADGGRLYADTVEFKPPGMFVIWQLIHQLIGTSPPVVLWVNILVTALTMLGVYWAGAAKPGGRWGGFWAMSFWALISGDMMLQANQPNNEVFINLFIAWGLALWVRADSAPAGRRLYAAAGFLLGLATLIKPVLVTVACMALAGLLAGGRNPTELKRRLRTILWVLLPVAACWGLMVLYFAWQGRAGDLYNCLVRYAVFYAESHGGFKEGHPAGIWTNILDGLTRNLIPSYLEFLMPLMVLTAWGIVNGLRTGQRPQALTLTGCLLGTFLCVSIPGTFFPHYYQFYLPLLAVGAGWGIVAAAQSLRQPLLAPGIALVTLALLLWHVVPTLRLDANAWSRLKYQDSIFIEVKRCGQAVNQLLTTNETFYVWGMDPGIFYYSQRQPASGIFWANRLTAGPLKDQTTQKVIADLRRNQPPLILIQQRGDFAAPSTNHLLFQYMTRHYVESPEAGFSSLFTVYVRRDSALARRLATNSEPFFLTLTDTDPLFVKLSCYALLEQGTSRYARAYLQKLEDLDQGNPTDDNQLAWLLATAPDPHLRDGLKAVNYAQRACAATRNRNSVFLGTLGAAYAEAGQFDAAIAAAQKACDLAQKSDQSALLQSNRALLALYRRHKAYHQPAAE